MYTTGGNPALGVRLPASLLSCAVGHAVGQFANLGFHLFVLVFYLLFVCLFLIKPIKQQSENIQFRGLVGLVYLLVLELPIYVAVLFSFCTWGEGQAWLVSHSSSRRTWSYQDQHKR